MTSEAKIRVRYYETGQMGFVHHSNYFNWFDLAQEKLISDIGFDYARIEERGLKFIPVHQSCDYLAPIYYRDELIIKISLKEIKGIKLSFEYEIVKAADAKIAARGESDHILVDENLHPVIIRRVVPELAERLNKLNKF